MVRVKTRTLPEDREIFSLRHDRPIAGVPMLPVRAEMEVSAWSVRIIAGASAASG
jgi:hypothetical protein